MSYIGYPEHDYAKEARENRAWHMIRGWFDAVNGRPPNEYLYRFAAPDYHIAAGYREGYNMAGSFRVQGKLRQTYYQRKALQEIILKDEES